MKNIIQLQCPNCDIDILSADINLEKVLAKCSACHTVFSFEEKLITLPRSRPEVFLPKGIEILKLRSELSIDISWRKTFSTFLIIFTVFWNAIVLPFALFAILSGEYIMLLGLSLHLLVGIGLIYWMLTILFNTTYITVDEYNLAIEHKPLRVPFYPDKTIPAMDVKQLFVKKYVASKTNGNPNYAYGLYAILKNNDQVKLLKGLKHPNQALYVEQEIEEFLHIKDKVIDEEWKG